MIDSEVLALLNQRVSHVNAIVPALIPEYKLPMDAHPTVGWVKRQVFKKLFGADEQKMNTKLHIPRNWMPDDGEGPSTSQLPQFVGKYLYPAVFARLDVNPGLPTSPGQPGTLITSRTDVPTGKAVFVVVRCMDPFWLYVGRYILRKHDEPVSTQEWEKMPEVVSTFRRYFNTRANQSPQYVRSRRSGARNSPIPRH